MKLHTYLNYGGNCRQAFEFYAEHLGGTITSVTTHGELPGSSEIAPEWRDADLDAAGPVRDVVDAAARARGGVGSVA